MEKIDTAALSALFQQVIFYAIVSSIVVDGIKKTIKAAINKTADGTVQVHRGISLGLMYAFGFTCCFFLKSPVIDSIWIRLFFGFIIGNVGVGSYEAVVRSALELIPNLMNKFFNK
jgi:hypothetical protein